MRLVNTAKVGTDAIGQLGGRQQPRRLDDGPLAVPPLGLDWIEPRALAGQIAHQDPHALAGAFDLSVVLANPRADRAADMPGSVVPNQDPDLDPLAPQRL